MTRGQEAGKVCTLGCTPAVSQTRKQAHHWLGSVVTVLSMPVDGLVGVSTGWRRRSSCRGARCTDLSPVPPNTVSFMPAIASTSGRLHSEFVRLLFVQAHRDTDHFFAASGVQLAQPNSGLFHFSRAAFSAQLKEKVVSTLVMAATLRVNLNIDGAPITSTTHTHPSHSQTSRLLTSSLSLGVPVPRVTQCM